MSDDRPLDLLDDEVPPDIPDISDPTTSAQSASDGEAAVDAPPASLSATRRLAPPPKPMKRASPTSPGLEVGAATRKPTVPPDAPQPPIFARPGAPLGAIAPPPAAKLPLSQTQPLLNPLQSPAQQPQPAQPKLGAAATAKIPTATQPLGTPSAPPQRALDPSLASTQPLGQEAVPQSPPAPEAAPQAPVKSRRLSNTQPDTPAARLPLPTPVTPPPSVRSSDPSDVLRRVAEPPRPRAAAPRPGSEPPRPASSPAITSDRPAAQRAPSAPIDVRTSSSPLPPPKSPAPVAALSSSQPPPRPAAPSAPIDVYDPRPPPAPSLPTGIGPTPPQPARAALRDSGPRDVEPLAPRPAEDPVVASEPKATAILAMRIIVVGESSRVELRSDAPPPLESTPPAPLERTPPAALESPPPPLESPPLPLESPPPPEEAAFEEPTLDEAEPAPASGPPPALSAFADTAEELAEEDVAPDSEERVPLAGPASVPPGDDPARRPPPPPRRPPSVAAEAPAREKTEKLDLAQPREKPEAAPVQRERKETLDEAPRGRQRRPWWEELFGEDFIRATQRLSDSQVRAECSFIEESLGVAAGGVVLDLGCGAGYHAVELASRGYGVVGYDLSLFQLALAADVAQERDQRLNFLQGDMREMAFEEMFDGVYCWNTTFGYFEEEKNVAVAQRVFKALRPGGMFLLDVANRDFVVAQSPSQVWYEGEGCVCMDDMSVDFITSRLRVKRSVILDDGRTRECPYSIRLYSLHELGKLLHEVGFRVTEASGHPSMPGVFFGQYSPRIIILAQRP